MESPDFQGLSPGCRVYGGERLCRDGPVPQSWQDPTCGQARSICLTGTSAGPLCHSTPGVYQQTQAGDDGESVQPQGFRAGPARLHFPCIPAAAPLPGLLLLRLS